MHRTMRLTACFFLIWGTVGASAGRAQEWTRFRGPNGSGLSSARGIPVEWAETDYAWRVELPGVGHASPVLWGERLFLLAGDEDTGRRRVLCLNSLTAEQVWERGYDSAVHRKHQLNSFASSTPAVDREHLYCCWATPESLTVVALDHQGREKWQADLGPFNAGHGFGVSPIVVEDLLVVGCDHEGDSSAVALDRTTGEIRWRVPRATKVAYSTPCVHQVGNRPAELIFTNWEYGIMALDPRTGRTNWSIKVFDPNHLETSIGSPVLSGDLVLGTCGYLGYATHTVAVRPDAAAENRVREVYRVDRGAPLTTTPLVVNGLLFLWGDNGIVTCVDANNGGPIWRERLGGTYYGSPIATADAVYCLSADGEAVVLAASRDFKLLSRNPLGESSHSTPAIANGRLYLRTFSHLLCVAANSAERPREK